MKLSPREFRRSLHAGLGRALRDVRSVPEEDRREILLDSCLYNRTYDPQLESDRAAWLCEVLEASGHLAAIAEGFFEEIPGDAKSWDYDQRIHLAREFGLRGIRDPGEILRRELHRGSLEDSHNHPPMIASDLIRLEGLLALAEIAKFLGNRIDPKGSWSDSMDCEMLTGEAAERFGWTAVEETLRTSAASDAGAARFLSAVEERIARGSNERKPREFDPQLEFWGKFDFDQVRSRIEGSDPSKVAVQVWTTRWGKWVASEADLEKALDALAKETDRTRLKIWLAIFALRRMPRFEPRILDLLDDPDAGISWNAGRAIKHVEHDDIRRRGLDRLHAGQCDATTMQLLRSNFRTEDVPMLLRALPNEGDLEPHHAAAFGIRDIAESRGPVGLRDLLEWTYENAGCSLCRKEAVRMLVDAGDGRASILEECRFDANPELREFARATLAGAPGPTST